MKNKRATMLAFVVVFVAGAAGAVPLAVTPQIPPTFPHPRSRVLPLKVKLALAGVAMATGAGMVALALRQAKRAHFFSRTYRFDQTEPIAARLSAPHCGGFVVMIRFDEQERRNQLRL